MDTGLEFLRNQVANAVAQHDTFLQSLVDHEGATEDQRFRDLCARHLPRVREQQRMLEEYEQQLATGASQGSDATKGVTQSVRKLAGEALGMAKQLADAAPQSDFVRLVSDVMMGRQAEDTFKTFREGGRSLGIVPLAHLGEVGERSMDEFVKDANRLVKQMFVERARGAEFTMQARASLRPSLSD